MRTGLIWHHSQPRGNHVIGVERFLVYPAQDVISEPEVLASDAAIVFANLLDLEIVIREFSSVRKRNIHRRMHSQIERIEKCDPSAFPSAVDPLNQHLPQRFPFLIWFHKTP